MVILGVDVDQDVEQPSGKPIALRQRPAPKTPQSSSFRRASDFGLYQSGRAALMVNRIHADAISCRLIIRFSLRFHVSPFQHTPEFTMQYRSVDVF